MKKLYLKNRIEKLIIIYQILLIIMLTSECDNITQFIISKLILLALIYINHNIIKKYTKFYDLERK